MGFVLFCFILFCFVCVGVPKVYICGGQSNMQFAMPAIANATEEIARADQYPLIRLFSVGQKTSSLQVQKNTPKKLTQNVLSREH